MAALSQNVDARAPYAEARVGPNRVSLLRDGYQAYPAMLAAIAGAKSTICLETYIIRDDETGMRFIDALIARARAGVEVLVMYDFWGSEVSDINLAAMRAAGVKLLIFRPWRYLGSFSRAFARVRRRNHRKSLIVDGAVGFTGGLNISNDYAAPEDGGQGWRDTHVQITGPDAVLLERLFLTTWDTHRGPPFDGIRFRRARNAACEKLRVVGNEFALERKGIRRAYEDAFTHAKQRIFITNAYFLPPAKMIKTLVAAAKRGVRVGVILAGTTDVKLVLYAARGLYAKLLKNRIEVYEWTGSRNLHAKTAVVDGKWCTIGSSNLDPLSLRQNLEVNAVIVEPSFGASLEKLFAEDLEQCQRVTIEHVRSFGLFERALSWIAFRLRHWL